MSSKSIDKTVIMGTGKVEGKIKVWVAAVFNDIKAAKPWVALLKLAHESGNHALVKAMDVHAPTAADGTPPTSVRYTAAVTQYAPEPGGLDDDIELGGTPAPAVKASTNA